MNCCRSCKSSIPARQGSGRPARYCSDSCRRRTDLRTKRLRRRLERLEEHYDTLLVIGDDVTTTETLMTGRTVPQQRRACAALIHDAENALVKILTEDET